MANGDILVTDQIVHNLSWWCHGHTMCADMQVLDLGAYDAILGYDWLSQHSPMVCDWANYYVEFQEKDRKVKLQGIQPVPLQLQAISADSFMKWHKGNGIWALAVWFIKYPLPPKPLLLK